VGQHRGGAATRTFGLLPIKVASRRSGKHRQRPGTPAEAVASNSRQPFPRRIEQLRYAPPRHGRQRVKCSGIGQLLIA
jgi:hypothetical protein